MKSFFTIVFLIGTLFSVSGQDIMLQSWYWNYPKTANGHKWADTLISRIPSWKSGGITQVWLPPLSRASFGSGSNGYDPKDLYDLGEFGQGPTGFGTRGDVNAVMSALNGAGMIGVADVVYNHRDGGKAETNTAVEGWIRNFTSAKRNSGDNCFPSDRFRAILPLGGSNLNGAGQYFLKIRSNSQHPDYFNKPYKLYVTTKKMQSVPNRASGFEFEPNGGGGCGTSNVLVCNRDISANTDASGCNLVDEYSLTLADSNFFNTGDTLYVYLSNQGGNYSDHHIWECWNAARSVNMQNDFRYQTYTDFTGMPSGQGGMNWTNFKPNGSPTKLDGDWDWLWFFYDYDQNVASTANALNNWTDWLWTNVGIRGLRMDAVKHFSPAFVGQMLNFMNAAGKNPPMVVGEFYDGNVALLKSWVDAVTAAMNTPTKAAVKVRAFDFGIRDALKNACDNGSYDVRNIFNSGMVDGAGMQGFNVVTFANNHDFRDPGQPIQNKTNLAYAYLLTNNKIGLPCIYYPEYTGVPVVNHPTLNLKEELDALIQIHKLHIFGATSIDYLNRFSTPYSSNFIQGGSNKALIYQIKNHPSNRDIIVAINFNSTTLRVDQQINSAGINPGSIFTDLLGRSNFPTAVLNGSNQLYFELPPNSYSVWIEDCDGTTSTWTGRNNNVWSNPLNWSCGVVPTVGTNVIIPFGAPNYPLITTSAEIKSLTMYLKSNMTVMPGVVFKLNGL
jgi:hypothetical protein